MARALRTASPKGRRRLSRGQETSPEARLRAALRRLRIEHVHEGLIAAGVCSLGDAWACSASVLAAVVPDPEQRNKLVREAEKQLYAAALRDLPAALEAYDGAISSAEDIALQVVRPSRNRTELARVSAAAAQARDELASCAALVAPSAGRRRSSQARKLVLSRSPRRGSAASSARGSVVLTAESSALQDICASLDGLRGSAALALLRRYAAAALPCPTTLPRPGGWPLARLPPAPSKQKSGGANPFAALLSTGNVLQAAHRLSLRLAPPPVDAPPLVAVVAAAAVAGLQCGRTCCGMSAAVAGVVGMAAAVQVQEAAAAADASDAKQRRVCADIVAAVASDKLRLARWRHWADFARRRGWQRRAATSLAFASRRLLAVRAWMRLVTVAASARRRRSAGTSSACTALLLSRAEDRVRAKSWQVWRRWAERTTAVRQQRGQLLALRWQDSAQAQLRSNAHSERAAAALRCCSLRHARMGTWRKLRAAAVERRSRRRGAAALATSSLRRTRLRAWHKMECGVRERSGRRRGAGALRLQADRQSAALAAARRQSAARAAWTGLCAAARESRQSDAASAALRCSCLRNDRLRVWWRWLRWREGRSRRRRAAVAAPVYAGVLRVGSGRRRWFRQCETRTDAFGSCPLVPGADSEPLSAACAAAADAVRARAGRVPQLLSDDEAALLVPEAGRVTCTARVLSDELLLDCVCEPLPLRVGARVRRNRQHWSGGDADGGDTGTVEEVVDGGRAAWVVWERTGARYLHSWGQGCFQVVPTTRLPPQAWTARLRLWLDCPSAGSAVAAAADVVAKGNPVSRLVLDDAHGADTLLAAVRSNSFVVAVHGATAVSQAPARRALDVLCASRRAPLPMPLLRRLGRDWPATVAAAIADEPVWPLPLADFGRSLRGPARQLYEELTALRRCGRPAVGQLSLIVVADWRESTAAEVAGLLQSGAQPCERDADGHPPLHHAVAEAGWAAALPVLSLLVTPRAVSADAAAAAQGTGANCLHRACRYGAPEVAAFVLSERPELARRDRQGRTPLFLATENPLFDTGTDAADSAIGSLCGLGCGGGTDADGWTVLHSACFHRRLRMVRALLRFGADALAADADGDPPIVTAQQVLSQSSSPGDMGGIIRCLTACHCAAAGVTAALAAALCAHGDQVLSRSCISCPP
eukprot:TRINITY_DN18461_c0_g1_i1.p1 TRINITY_DN18461_c0_g1~~TRINITY_DN18461_c0_g1_i1.p1  ORF type:complete len:1183 (+),score=379.16 TRINITY_DN18461_c0_g1_i1:53-3550(+)